VDGDAVTGADGFVDLDLGVLGAWSLWRRTHSLNPEGWRPLWTGKSPTRLRAAGLVIEWISGCLPVSASWQTYPSPVGTREAVGSGFQ
jgi:hypothetical protein